MRIVPKVNRYDETYPEDVDRIVHTCRRSGYGICREDAVTIWQNRSSAWCAGWLILPEDDDDLIEAVLDYGTLVKE